MSRPRRYAVLLFPGFPMMAFSAVIEPLRAANALGAAPPYAWPTVSAKGRAVNSSSGITLACDFTVAENPAADAIVVCSGGDADQIVAEPPLAWIRRNLRFVQQRYTSVMHGVGMHVETPFVAHATDFAAYGHEGTLRPGMVVSVESYIGEVGGPEVLKLEEEVLVTETGGHAISRFPYEDELMGPGGG